MTTRKLFGKDLGEFDDVDVDDLLTQLSAEELEILSKEVDPDVCIIFPIILGHHLWFYSGMLPFSFILYHAGPIHAAGSTDELPL